MRSSRVYTIEGIIIRRKAVGEADRILTVFTKHRGKLRVLAKGVRRITSRRAGHLEVFSHVMLTLHAHPKLDIVSEATSVRRGGTFEGDLGRVGYAYCMCELVDQLTAEGDAHEEIFFLLRDGLAALLTLPDSNSWQTQIGHFIHSLLWMLGFLQMSRRLPPESMQSYVEHITERKLKSWPLLTVLSGPV